MRGSGVEVRPCVAVVGAGIGGLALAAVLTASGTRCEVFEQERRATAGGAGLELAPNAVRPLHRLGLGPVLRAKAVRAEAMEVRSQEGRPMARVALGTACERRFKAPYYTVRRADLREALLERVPEDRVHFGRRLVSVTEDADGVTLRLEDGSTRRADVVVGADGVCSTVRETLVPDQSSFSGLGVLYGLLPTERLPRTLVREPAVRRWLGPDAQLVCYPVSGGSQISFHATVRLEQRAVESWSAEGGVEDLARAVGDWRGVPAQIASAARTAGTVECRALYDREPLKQWAAGRTAVVGDAAHPALLFTTLGASQSVEDAVELAVGLAAAQRAELPEVLARYEAGRLPRTASVAQAVRGITELLPAPGGAGGQAEREAELQRRMTLQSLAPLYSHEVVR